MRLSNTSEQFLVDILPLLMWMMVIFVFSDLPSLGLGGYPTPLWIFIERKGAHVAEYCILTGLFFRFFQNRFPSEMTKVTAASMLCSLAYACSDEIHQLFVFGREGKISDVMIDFVGIALIALLAVLWFRYKNNKKTAR